MIAWIQGVIIHVDGNEFVIDAGGIGYEVTVAENTSRRLNLKLGKECRLAIHSSFRDNETLLIGFDDFVARHVFRRLIGINGVGAKVAMMITDRVELEDLLNAVEYQNPSLLETIPGIGKKTARRIILELENKLTSPLIIAAGSHNPVSVSRSNLGSENVNQDEQNDMRQITRALNNLGFSRQEISGVLAKIDMCLPIEEKIKSALRQLDKSND